MKKLFLFLTMFFYLTIFSGCLNLPDFSGLASNLQLPKPCGESGCINIAKDTENKELDITVGKPFNVTLANLLDRLPPEKDISTCVLSKCPFADITNINISKFIASPK